MRIQLASQKKACQPQKWQETPTLCTSFSHSIPPQNVTFTSWWMGATLPWVPGRFRAWAATFSGSNGGHFRQTFPRTRSWSKRTPLQLDRRRTSERNFFTLRKEVCCDQMPRRTRPNYRVNIFKQMTICILKLFRDFKIYSIAILYYMVIKVITSFKAKPFRFPTVLSINFFFGVS